MVSQLNRDYKVEDDTMAAYVKRLHNAIRVLKHFSIMHTHRLKNCYADTLSKLASSSEDGKPKQIQWKTLG